MRSRQTLVLLTAAALLGTTDPVEGAEHPNVVILLADDLGWGDLGRHGGPVPTPHMDRLIDQGVELANFMVMPVCSPARASLLTGRHPVRIGLAPGVVNADTGVSMRGEETTLAEAFRGSDYSTALIGKWHLGFLPTPNQQGFDLFHGLYGAANDYFDRTRKRDGTVDWRRNSKYTDPPLVEKGYTTDLVRDRAVEYIEQVGKRPFFLYVSFTAVHNPLQAPARYLERVEATVADPAYRTYAAMTIALDDAVGTILKALDDRRLAQDTIVFFASDNGATPTGRNLPFRGGKHTLYEGGVHSPAAVRWIGRLRPGSRVEGLLGLEDVYPTLLTLADAPIPDGLRLDGFDATDCLLDGAPSPREHYCWLWKDCDAIRTQRWKLLRRANSRELFDLHSDPGESRNLADALPERVKDLETRLNNWQASIPCYPSHVPVSLDRPAKAEPSGDVLELRATREDAASKSLSVVLAQADIFIKPSDRLSYDMLVTEDSDSHRFAVDVCGHAAAPLFLNRKPVVVQHGTTQNRLPGFSQAQGKWSRRVIGLGNLGPPPIHVCRVTLAGEENAKYHLYLDNIVIERANGQVVELYRDGLPNNGEITSTENGWDVSLRAVPYKPDQPATRN